MRILKRLLSVCTAIVLFPGFFFMGPAAADDLISRIAPEAYATVTFVEGAPVLVGSGSAPKPVISGQELYAGSTLQTDSASRLELTISGGGVVRMAEATAIELAAGNEGIVNPVDRLQIMVLKGEIWANFSNSPDTVQILAACGLFSGPQSVFRVVMYEGGAVEAKVYAGQVTASGPFEIKKENDLYEPGALKGTGDAAPEPWRYQITPYRKVIALATGEATPPFRFAAKSDLTDWVRWNEQRDEAENNR